MANAKLHVEFLPNGAVKLRFDGIDGVTPGRLERVNLQARKELKRLCGVAGVEARRRRAEKAKEQEAADERDRALKAEAKAEAEAEIADAEDEEEEEDAEEEEPVTGS